MSATCEEIICCPPKIGEYLAGGGGMRQAGVLLNVAFKATPTAKAGFAATGIAPEDFWNTFNNAAATQALKDSQGQDTDVVLEISGAAAASFGDNGNTDVMVRSFLEQTNSGFEPFLQFTGLAAGTYDLYVYGFSNQAGDIDGLSNRSGSFFALIDGVPYPVTPPLFYTNYQALLVNAPPWFRGINFERIPQIPITAGQVLGVKCTQVLPRNGKVSGLQLIRNPAPEAPGPGRGEVTPSIASGAPVFFLDGHDLIAGRYRVTYLDGAVGYNGGPGWTVNDFISGRFNVLHSGGVAVTGEWVSGSYPAYQPTQAAVAADLAGSWVDFNHTGGTIAMALQGAAYFAMVAGSPNPRFALSRLD